MHIYLEVKFEGLILVNFTPMEYVKIIERYGKFVVIAVNEDYAKLTSKKWITYKVEDGNFISAPNISKIILSKNRHTLDFNLIDNMYISEDIGLTQRDLDDMAYAEFVVDAE